MINKRNIHTIFGILFFIFFTNCLHAQESLSGLQFNTTIKQYLENKSSRGQAAPSSEVILTLPFFDDFKYDGPYPDPTKWSDNFVFVNTSFQKFPANRGVATFDALDENGKIYSFATTTAFEADKLTSQKIRTDSVFGAEQRPLSVQDSLYLSFYFQPQGLGNNPEKDDILKVEFFEAYADTIITIDSVYIAADTIWDSDSTWIAIDSAYWKYDTIMNIYGERWKTMWYSEGETIDSFYRKNGTWMRHVMIPITDPNDFRPDFRFRFVNFASIGNNILPSWQSNMDQWNVDYVYINYNRFFFDTTYRDISFVNPGVSLLKDYSSMPYAQFKKDAFNAMKSDFELVYSNLDEKTQNIDYAYRIYNADGSLVPANYSSIEWSTYVLPFITHGFVTEKSNVVAIYPIAPLLDSNEFIVKQWIEGDDMALSDSVTYKQVFKNFYAYDDGFPELGYGITPATSKMALYFELNKRDTLRAVDIFFNSTLDRNGDNHIEFFELAIWNDNHRKPDQKIYSQRMTLKGEETGKFTRFYLDEVLEMGVGGFYVGTIQETDDNLNIGFDKSNNQKNRLYYKTPSDDWRNSEFDGSVMIRPVFGKKIHEYPEPTATAPQKLTVAPNPISKTNNTFRLILPYDYDVMEHDLWVEVFNLTGQKVYSASYTETVSLHHVSSGIYIVRVSNQTIGSLKTTKLIVL